MHAILTERPAYAGLVKRRNELDRKEREFIQKLQRERAAHSEAVSGAAMSGADLPDPPVDPGPAATLRFNAERRAIGERLAAVVAEAEAEVETQAASRQAELLAEVRERLVPRLEEIAAEIALLGRTVSHARVTGGAPYSAMPNARTSVGGPEELIHVAIAGGDFLHWENGMGRPAQVFSGMSA